MVAPALNPRPRSWTCQGARSTIASTTSLSNENKKLSRRELIQIGYSSALGASLAAFTGGRSRAGEGVAERSLPRAKSVLFVFLFGGPSHLDTFDPKPEAPAEYRGEFRPIATSSQRRADLRALAARWRARMDRWSLVRSMTCNPSFGDHRLAVHGLLGGIDELPPGATLAASRRDWPCWCAGVEYVRARSDGLPASVVLPGDVVDPGTGLVSGTERGTAGGEVRPLSTCAATRPIPSTTSTTACGWPPA